jgi:hypothetical protein
LSFVNAQGEEVDSEEESEEVSQEQVEEDQEQNQEVDEVAEHDAGHWPTIPISGAVSHRSEITQSERSSRLPRLEGSLLETPGPDLMAPDTTPVGTPNHSPSSHRTPSTITPEDNHETAEDTTTNFSSRVDAADDGNRLHVPNQPPRRRILWIGGSPPRPDFLTDHGYSADSTQEYAENIAAAAAASEEALGHETIVGSVPSMRMGNDTPHFDTPRTTEDQGQDGLFRPVTPPTPDRLVIGPELLAYEPLLGDLSPSRLRPITPPTLDPSQPPQLPELPSFDSSINFDLA